MESKVSMDYIIKIGKEESKKGNAPPLRFLWLSMRKASELAKKLNADIQVIEAALWLGDSRVLLCMREKRLNEHIKEGALFARKVMKDAKCSQEFIERVVNCIEEHHSKTHKTIEGEIVANADGYRFLEPEGLLFLQYKNANTMEYLEVLKYMESKLEEKWATLTILECKKEMKQKYESMKFTLKQAIETEELYLKEKW